MLYVLRHFAIGMLTALPLAWTDVAVADDEAPATYRLTDINPAGIGGTVMLHGAGPIANSLRSEFVNAAGGTSARIVFISLGNPLRRIGENLSRATDRRDSTAPIDPAEFWKTVEAISVDQLQPRRPEQLSAESTLELLRNATGVWFEESQLGASEWGSAELAGALQSVLDRGGLIGGTRAVALLADHYTIDQDGETQTLPGLGLLPQVVITHAELPPQPGCVTVYVEPDTVAFIHQRTIGVVGSGTVHISPHYHVAQGGDTLQLGDGEIADLTALRRMATLGPRFRRGDDEPAACEVPHGSLMIVGGGGFTNEMLEKFVELAGGDAAKIIVVPSAEEQVQLEGRGDVQEFLSAGAASVHVLHTTDRLAADSDDFIAPLTDATGIWFGGGRQWRFVDAYAGTKTETAMREVLERGGVIGGSSAGATIQGDFLVRGNPLGNVDMMSAGYEDGFGYLPGSAIDQHFTQRDRHPDMVLFKTHLPRWLGVGIDETTAIVVSGRTAEVMGQGNVYFFDGQTPEEAEQRTEVAPGQTYDLLERKLVESP